MFGGIATAAIPGGIVRKAIKFIPIFCLVDIVCHSHILEKGSVVEIVLVECLRLGLLVGLLLIFFFVCVAHSISCTRKQGVCRPIMFGGGMSSIHRCEGFLSVLTLGQIAPI